MKTFYRFTDDVTRKKILWLTDLHLDAAGKAQLDHFYSLLEGVDCQLTLVSGDICNGHFFTQQLEKIYAITKKPLYFVLGNHDFYRSGIDETRALAEAIPNNHIHYLTQNKIVPIAESVALIGHDGWADGREGDFINSTVQLWDYRHIKDLAFFPREDLLNKLNKLGDEAVEKLEPLLKQALVEFDRVVVLTHPPPYKEACLYDNHPCDDNWGPHFVCKALGDRLLEFAEEYQQKQILVLCGHAHHGADVWIRPNLHVITGHSDLGLPLPQGFLEV